MEGYQSDHTIDLGIPFGNTTGTADSYVLNLSMPLTQYAVGLALRVKFHVANQASVLLNINGLGSVALKKAVNGAWVNLESGDLNTQTIYDLTFDGSAFQVVTGIVQTTSSTSLPSGLLTLKGYLDGAQSPAFPEAERGDCYTIIGDGVLGISEFAEGLQVYTGDLIYAASGNPGGNYEDLQRDWLLLSGGAVNRNF